MPLTKYPENDKELARKPLAVASPIVVVTKDGKHRRFHPGHYGYREDNGRAEMLVEESVVEIEERFHHQVPPGAFAPVVWLRIEMIEGIRNG